MCFLTSHLVIDTLVIVWIIRTNPWSSYQRTSTYFWSKQSICSLAKFNFAQLCSEVKIAPRVVIRGISASMDWIHLNFDFVCLAICYRVPSLWLTLSLRPMSHSSTVHLSSSITATCVHLAGLNFRDSHFTVNNSGVQKQRFTATSNFNELYLPKYRSYFVFIQVFVIRYTKSADCVMRKTSFNRHKFVVSNHCNEPTLFNQRLIQ